MDAKQVYAICIREKNEFEFSLFAENIVSYSFAKKWAEDLWKHSAIVAEAYSVKEDGTITYITASKDGINVW